MIVFYLFLCFWGGYFSPCIFAGAYNSNCNGYVWRDKQVSPYSSRARGLTNSYRKPRQFSCYLFNISESSLVLVQQLDHCSSTYKTRTFKKNATHNCIWQILRAWRYIRTYRAVTQTLSAAFIEKKRKTKTHRTWVVGSDDCDNYGDAQLDGDRDGLVVVVVRVSLQLY